MGGRLPSPCKLQHFLIGLWGTQCYDGYRYHAGQLADKARDILAGKQADCDNVSTSASSANIVENQFTATSVTDAVRGDFLVPGVPALVQAKSNHIEVHSLESTGLRLALDCPVQGTILKIAAIRLRNCPTAALAVLTTSFTLFVVAFGDGAARTLASQSVAERGATRSSELITMVASSELSDNDAPTQFLVIHAFAGLLRIVLLDEQKPEKRKSSKATASTNIVDLSVGFTSRLQELILNSIHVLPSAQSADRHYKMAIIHTDHTGQRILQLHTISLSNRSVEMDTESVAYLSSTGLVLDDPDSRLMIPVNTDLLQGLIVVGQDSARFVHTAHISTPSNAPVESSNLANTTLTEEPNEDMAIDPFATQSPPRISSASKGKARMRDLPSSSATAGGAPTHTRRRSSAASSLMPSSPPSRPEASSPPEFSGAKRKLSESALSSGRGRANSTMRERMASKVIECNLPVSQYIAYCPIANDPLLFLLVDGWGHAIYLKLSMGQLVSRSAMSPPTSPIKLSTSPSSSINTTPRQRRSSRSGSMSGQSPLHIKLSYRQVANGRVSSPTCLVPLGDRYVFVGSHYGDSLLVRLPSSSSVKKDEQPRDASSMDVDVASGPGADGANELEIVNAFPNLAPIVDFCVVETDDGAGPSNMVTCSGGRDDGTLRVVRHGVGLSELASLDIDGIQRVWSLSSSSDAVHQDTIVLSFANESRVLSFDSDGAVEELSEFASFDLGLATILAHTACGQHFQVTTSAVTCTTSKWQPSSGSKVTTAAAYDDLLLLGTGGQELVLLRLSSDEIEVVATRTMPHDVSAVDLSRLDFAGDQQIILATVTLWQSLSVVTLAAPSLDLLEDVALETSFLPRSVVSTTLHVEGYDAASYLFVGLGDGSMISYSYRTDTGSQVRIDKSSKRVISLGSRPVSITRIATGGSENDGIPPMEAVLIASNRCTIASRERGKLAFANANAKDATGACTFNHSTYTNALVLASPTGIQIGKIDSLQKLHIRTIRLGDEAPRRITHSTKQKAYGVIFLRERLERSTGDIHRSSSFKVLDESTFAVLASFDLERQEEARSVAMVSMADGQEYFAVGTAYINPEEEEAFKGRVLLYQAAEMQEWRLFGKYDVHGAVHAITQLPGDYFAAAINHSVKTFRLRSNADPQESGSWSSSFISYGLVSRGNIMIAIDPLRSASILRVDTDTNPERALVKEVARDLTAYGIFAAAFIASDRTGKGDSVQEGKRLAGDDATVKSENTAIAEAGLSIVVADLDENLFTANIVNSGHAILDYAFRPTSEPSYVLAQQGRIHIGEIVNKFVEGTLVAGYSDTDHRGRSVIRQANPCLLFCTSVGSIGVLADVPSSETGQLLTSLERNLRRYADVRGAGNLSQMDYRAFKSEYKNQPAAGFIDGSLVEVLLDLSPEEVDAVLAGKSEHEKISATRETVVALVEELQRLR